MHSASEATEIIHAHALPRLTHDLDWQQCAGRVLAQAILADRDFPPFDRVAMDGIAISLEGWRTGHRRFVITGRQAAGQPRGRLDSPGSCLEVMTGAILPEGCDAVIPVEQLRVDGDRAEVTAAIEPQPMDHVHPRASDRRAGEVLLQPGTVIRSPELAVLATVGQTRIRVAARPVIRVIATGDELVPVEHTPLPHQIRLSNGHALVAGLQGKGFSVSPCTWVPDDRQALVAALGEALGAAQVLVISGGVSMGACDLVPGALQDCGVHCVFHKVAQRPGKPLWYGRGPAGQAVFALPGNPVSTAVCLHRYVLPWLEHGHTGRRPRPLAVCLASPATRAGALTRFLPVRLEEGADGRTLAHPEPTAGSGDFARLCASHGFVELDPGAAEAPAGSVLPCWLWS
jgi:molybdopterin molybdotransferase